MAFFKKLKNNKIFSIISGYLSVVIILWVFALPIGAGLNEGDNGIYAASVARGSVFLPFKEVDFVPSWRAQVPAWVAAITKSWILEAFDKGGALHPNPSQFIAESSNSYVLTTTNLAHLPPFFYFLVGIPSLIFSGLFAAYSMRLITALICLVFILISLYLVSRNSNNKLSIAGLVFALSPEAYFLFSTITANGIEVASACLVFTATALLCTEQPQEKQIRLLRIWFLASSALCLVRTLSPVWVLVAALYLIIYIGPVALINLIKKHKDLYIYITILVVAGLLTFFWDLFRGSFPYQIAVYLTNSYHDESFISRFFISIKRVTTFYNQAFGHINNGNFFAGTVIYVLLIFVVISISFKNASTRQKLILVLGVAFNILLPALFESIKGNSLGQWWYGDYSLPLYVQSPIIAATFLSKSNGNERTKEILTNLLLVFAVLSQLTVLYLVARSYMVGFSGKIMVLFANSIWQGYPFGFESFYLLIDLIFSIATITLFVKPLGSLKNPFTSKTLNNSDLL